VKWSAPSPYFFHTESASPATGSLFNHADPPNVSYALDYTTESIRYTTTRDILAGEELCIFYGHRLWFSPQNDLGSPSTSTLEDADQDSFGSLTWCHPDGGDDIEDMPGAVIPEPDTDDSDEIVMEEDLPFTRVKLTPDEEEEEDEESIRTCMWSLYVLLHSYIHS
jgi:tRNA-specific adenosine deaminase 3